MENLVVLIAVALAAFTACLVEIVAFIHAYRKRMENCQRCYRGCCPETLDKAV